MSDASESHVSKVGNSTVTVGRFTYGHNQMRVRQWGEGASLTIGAFCSIAKGLTVVLGGNHRVDWATTFPFGHVFHKELGDTKIEGHPDTQGDITIGNDVWIGQNVTIMSGVEIGSGAVIAANATVVKNIAPYEIWGGNPAKKLKDRFEPDVAAALLDLAWWNLPVETVRTLAPLLSRTPDLPGIEEMKRIARG